MKIRVQSMGDLSLGALGKTTHVDQTIDVAEADQPRIEITLASGKTLEIYEIDADRLLIAASGGPHHILIAPRYANVAQIIVT